MIYSEKTDFDGEALAEAAKNMPNGASKLAFLADAIRKADDAGDNYWRLLLRFDYASQATHHDDPPKAMPVAAEFMQIFEENPTALAAAEDNGDVEMYLMITQMAIDPIVFLPQIPLEQWQELMQQFWMLVKRYHVGLRTYWWQMCRFWQYIDKEEAFKYFEKFWKTGRDGISDCRACERSYAVHMSLLIGDRKSADAYAKPMDDGRLWFCHDTPHIYIFAYLEDAMNRGDLREAERRARNLYGKSDRDRNDLSYLGAVLRCWAFTDLDRGVELIQKRLEWTFNMWDQKKLYDFYKGACLCFRELAQRTDMTKLELPKEFPLYRENGVYEPSVLYDWFYTQAKEIGSRFDKRNGSNYFADDLALALQFHI